MYLIPNTFDMQEGPRTMVGIATFDSAIHFYNLKRAMQQVCATFWLLQNFLVILTYADFMLFYFKFPSPFPPKKGYHMHHVHVDS